MSDKQIETNEIKRKKDKLLEQQKKFKNLEQDKKFFTDQTINIIKKQKIAIEKIKKQNQVLKELIAKVNNQKNQDKGISYQNMKDLINQINIAIQSEKQTQKNIDTHIENFQKKIIEKKKNCMGVNSGTQSQKNLQKQIKILQNRLDKANQKFNQTIAVNKDLKLVIDSLRRQRVIFDNLYQKLEKQLHQKRKKMADIIQKANNAYQQRDKANNQVQTLKQHARKQATEFQKEIKQMSYGMEKAKLSNFTKKAPKASELIPNFYDSQPVIETKNAKQSRKSAEQIEKVQKFRQDFSKIQAATEIRDFQQLLRIFSQNQQKNFQMFKFVNLQSNQIQQLQFEVAKLRNQLEQQKPTNTGEVKQKVIDQLQKKLKLVSNQLQKCEAKYYNNQRQAKTIGGLIEKIFQNIDCDRQIAKEVGGSKTISETNLLVFLALVEHKGIQIVNTYKQLQNPHLTINNNKQNIPPQCILSFEDFDDNQEYDKILSADQLKKKADQFIKKQQDQKQKKKDIKLKKR